MSRIAARDAGAAPSVTALPNGIAVTFAEPTALAAIDVRNAQNNLLARLPLAGTRTRFEAPFAWPAAGRYLIELRWPAGRRQTELDVPTWPAVRATLEAPVGQNAIDLATTARTELLVPQSGTISLGVFVENLRQLASHYEVRCDWVQPCPARAMGAGN